MKHAKKAKGLNSNEVATLIVEDIINDITDRCSIGDCWEKLDEDVQEEIKESWKELINQYL